MCRRIPFPGYFAWERNRSISDDLILFLNRTGLSLNSGSSFNSIADVLHSKSARRAASLMVNPSFFATSERRSYSRSPSSVWTTFLVAKAQNHPDWDLRQFHLNVECKCDMQSGAISR